MPSTQTSPIYLSDDGPSIGVGRKPLLFFWGNYVAIRHENGIEAFPSGHFTYNPVKLNESNEPDASTRSAPKWLVELFIRAVKSPSKAGASFEVEVLKHVSKPVILVNCLDGCYGHCLYKLAYILLIEKNSEKDIVVIIHPAFRHLVPDSVSEIWSVRAPFNMLDFKIGGFHEFVTSQLERLQTFELAHVRMDLPLEEFDFTKLTKIHPFDFKGLKAGPFKVTLVLRDDRFWLRSRFDSFFYLVCIKFGWLRKMKWYFALRQKSYLRSFVKKLHRQLDLEVQAIGIGKILSLPFLKDERLDYTDFAAHEERWLQTYAGSHVCIGVHGSNMLLPSYLAGSSISLLPDFKIPNFSEEFIPKPGPAQRNMHVNRTLPLNTSPTQLTAHTVGIINGWRHGEKVSD
ncbi:MULTISPECIES: hypothetical protein [unclassified Imperialibacter]|uniref:hypothetical protein n=1 Tax=unclassified Imperialibacter TaxID=2629706 RepID=UPI00125B7AA5|nr:MULTISPECIES: hypothetical protein [unclassified Imperialibacter]CAD5257364.1 conserved hypothetical protein [Imperialibacter sp. 75]CAD5260244.1 conserved hypothetical protein [Imperialibacter sp. 89]VVT25670.1 conserved hypothetical protein [Imperialibacter sp. EC-SDR9]